MTTSTRPEIAQQQATIQAERFDLGAAKTISTPQLYGTGGWDDRGVVFPPNTNVVTLGVAVQFYPYDAGLTTGRVKTAQANLTAAQAQLTAEQQQVISDVSQAYLNLKTAEQRVITANSEVENGKESVRLNTGRFSAGLGIFLDVLDAQSALLTAQNNLVDAITAVNQARAALAHAIYTPLGK
jgi:outer membrane protein TolC